MKQNIPDRILAIHAELASLTLTQPTERSMGLIAELKSLTEGSCGKEAELAFDRENVRCALPLLNKLYADHGYLVERQRVEKYISEQRVELEAYESYGLIRKRVRYEVAAIEMVSGIDARAMRCLFVGSGPLPLSALLLAAEHGIRTTCIDRSLEAVHLSRQIVGLLGLSGMVEIKHADAESAGPCPSYTCVFVAGMAGTDTQEKMRIVRYLSSVSDDGTVFMLRSAEGMRRFLYAPIDETQLGDIQLHMKIVPYGTVENSLLVGIKNRKARLD